MTGYVRAEEPKFDGHIDNGMVILIANNKCLTHL